MSNMEKYVPERMCVCCRKLSGKQDLFRIVKDKEGNIAVDSTGKAQGRGAYLCKNSDCIGKSEKKGMLARALKSAVPKELYDELRSYIE